MAKRPVAADSAAEEELVVTVVRFKGSGETARKGIDAISQAMAAAFGPAATTKTITRKPAPALTNGSGAAADETIDAEAVDAADGEDEDVAPAATAKRERAPVKPPKPDSTLNVVPFKAVVTERNPKTMDQKYLVACLWLQEESGRETYGGPQILTCFRTMDWTEYADFTQPLRVMKRDTTYFDQNAPKRQWRLTENGLDVARKIKNSPTG